MGELITKYKSHSWFHPDSSTTYTGLAKNLGSNMVQREMLPNYVKLWTPVFVTKYTSGIRMRMKLFSFETKNYLKQDIKGQ